MDLKEVQVFLGSAISFCDLVENYTTNNDTNKLNQLLFSVSALYVQAISLPEVKPKHTEVSDLNFDLPDLKLKRNDTYWVVFEPYTFEEPVCGSLTDDLLDIYKDLKEGVLLYQRDKQVEATWYWKFNFEIHWGRHAINAMRALHSLNFN
ncbi:hypothetical protein ABE41_015095 [Fictibacillus arsenicus]|uniref:DUF5063 domain-containing protein n=1 Tax=Fictibacillus arsenicus TaxID=255247 RepID=A0A1B1Z784_9BACL|nr:DUF5063 domain-containing protein [Fictibacillus arsenicus]ANX13333.1 hypothetical protein ABE41_015095 [Fictibacillus arsenicus]